MHVMFLRKKSMDKQLIYKEKIVYSLYIDGKFIGLYNNYLKSHTYHDFYSVIFFAPRVHGYKTQLNHNFLHES